MQGIWLDLKIPQNEVIDICQKCISEANIPHFKFYHLRIML